MPKAPTREALYLDGPAGRLEAVLELPAGTEPAGAAVVLHPHPQHGGTMHNKVAHTLARAFLKSEFAALRFNFRGTENSEGSYDDGAGERDDAIAAVDWLRGRYPELDLWLAGFSFGAAMAVKAAAVENVDGLVSIAPAISRFADGLDTVPACPWLVVQGDLDELVDVDETIAWVNGLEPGPEIVVMDGAEHFFHGRLAELREIVSGFVRRER